MEEDAGVDVQNLAGDAVGAAEGDHLIGHVVDARRAAQHGALEGAGHEHFGLDNWQTDTWFDNLRISPL